MQRLKEKYQKEMVPALMQELGLTNKMEVPRLEKVVINMGVKEGAADIKILDQVAHELLFEVYFLEYFFLLPPAQNHELV